MGRLEETVSLVTQYKEAKTKLENMEQEALNATGEGYMERELALLEAAYNADLKALEEKVDIDTTVLNLSPEEKF